MLNRITGFPGDRARRDAWPDGEWVEVGMHGRRKYLLKRVEGELWPYSVQQSDLFAGDWRVSDG